MFLTKQTMVARAIPARSTIGYAKDVPIVSHISQTLKGLPPASELSTDTLYVTSSVFARLYDAWNVVSPDTSAGMCVRDAYSQLVSTKQLIAYARKVV